MSHVRKCQMTLWQAIAVQLHSCYFATCVISLQDLQRKYQFRAGGFISVSTCVCTLCVCTCMHAHVWHVCTHPLSLCAICVNAYLRTVCSEVFWVCQSIASTVPVKKETTLMRRQIDFVSVALVVPNCVVLFEWHQFSMCAVGWHWSSVCTVLMLRYGTGPMCMSGVPPAHPHTLSLCNVCMLQIQHIMDGVGVNVCLIKGCMLSVFMFV